MLGDSLAQNLAVGLAARAKRTGDMVVWNRGVSACPLGRGGRRWGGAYVATECSWWSTAQARAQIDEFVPSVVLVVAGVNDLASRARAEWGDDYRGPGDPAFDPWLLDEYRAVADAVRKGGVPVVWIPPPCVGWEGWEGYIGPDRDAERRRLHHNGTTIRALELSRPVRVGNLEAQLCPGGRFDPDALGIQNSRPDGLHLTDRAAEVLADRWLAPLLLEARR